MEVEQPASLVTALAGESSVHGGPTVCYALKFTVVLRSSCYLHFHFQMFGWLEVLVWFGLAGGFVLVCFSWLACVFSLLLTVCLILLPFSFYVIFPHLGNSLTYSVSF